jgi:hypothetical protein
MAFAEIINQFDNTDEEENEQ